MMLSRTFLATRAFILELIVTILVFLFVLRLTKWYNIITISKVDENLKFDIVPSSIQNVHGG